MLIALHGFSHTLLGLNLMAEYLPDGELELNNPTKHTNHSLCSSCGKKRLIAQDVVNGGVFYRICRTCQKNTAVIKVRNCLKCLKDFLSFCDYRICSKCKGRRWKDVVGIKK